MLITTIELPPVMISGLPDWWSAERAPTGGSLARPKKKPPLEAVGRGSGGLLLEHSSLCIAAPDLPSGASLVLCLPAFTSEIWCPTMPLHHFDGACLIDLGPGAK